MSLIHGCLYTLDRYSIIRKLCNSMRQACFIVIALTLHAARAQSKEDSLQLRRHATYFEILGSGLWGSVNHERLIKIGKLDGFVRLGAMYFPRGYPYSVSTFPLEFGLFRGEHNQFRLSAGTTYVYGGESGYDNSDILQRSSTIYGTITPMSFQIDKPNKKFYVRISFIALIPMHEFNSYYEGNFEESWPAYPFLGIAFGGINKSRRIK
jgi:hypothetical protein